MLIYNFLISKFNPSNAELNPICHLALLGAHHIFYTGALRVKYAVSPVPVAAQSKAYVFGSSLVGIAGSNPAEAMKVCLFWLLCVARQRPLRRADHSSIGILPRFGESECGSRNLNNGVGLEPLGLSKNKKRNVREKMHSLKGGMILLSRGMKSPAFYMLASLSPWLLWWYHLTLPFTAALCLQVTQQDIENYLQSFS